MNVFYASADPLKIQQDRAFWACSAGIKTAGKSAETIFLREKNIVDSS